MISWTQAENGGQTKMEEKTQEENKVQNRNICKIIT